MLVQHPVEATPEQHSLGRLSRSYALPSCITHVEMACMVLPAAHSMLRNAVRWQLASRAVGGPAGNVTPLLGLGGMAVVGAMGECHPTYAALFSSVPCCPFLGSVHFVGPACLLREG